MIAGALLLGACGDDNDDDVSSDDASSATTEGSASGESPDVIEVSGAIDEKPELELNGAGPVEELFIEDVVEGDGAEAAAGDSITVQYVGVLLDGEQFDASWDRGQPITFSLQGVIPGWQEGIPGMKEGGRRLLVIPSEMAYGESGTPDGSIGPGETLVFVVDLISIG